MSEKRSRRNTPGGKLFDRLSMFLPLRPGTRQASSGYTVIEVMIFLMVSSAMTFVVVSAFSGQQGRAEFNSAIRDVDSKFQDIINNVATGLYSSTANIGCTKESGGRIKLSKSAPTGQGENSDCIYIGQMVHFAPAGSDRRTINIYSVAGLRLDTGTGRETVNIHDSEPLLIADGGAPPFNGGPDKPDTTEVFNIPPGIRIANVAYYDGGAWVTTGGMGFFTTFGTYNTEGTLNSGSPTTNLVVLRTPPAPGLDEPTITMVRAMDQRLDNAGEYIINPPEGVKICFTGDGTSQVAVFTISGDKFTSTKVDVYSNLAAAVAAGAPC